MREDSKDKEVVEEGLRREMEGERLGREQEKSGGSYKNLISIRDRRRAKPPVHVIKTERYPYKK